MYDILLLYSTIIIALLQLSQIYAQLTAIDALLQHSTQDVVKTDNDTRTVVEATILDHNGTVAPVSAVAKPLTELQSLVSMNDEGKKEATFDIKPPPTPTPRNATSEGQCNFSRRIINSILFSLIYQQFSVFFFTIL